MSDSQYTARLARLRTLLAEQNLDALFVNQRENRRYLSGFTGSTGWLLVSADHALLATDFRYYEQVGLESPHVELVRLKRSPEEALQEMLARAGATHPAFESEYATYAEVQRWCEATPGVTWVPASGLVASLRAVKDPAELAAMRAAIRLADEAIGHARRLVRPGMTERALAWEIESFMRTHGAEAASFEVIVAAGANASLPHARAGDSEIAPGQTIVVDMGARLNGYCSDLTRTWCLGEPAEPDKFWEVYNTVLQAQLAAQAAVVPGMTGREADAVARQVISAAGYGDHFGHGLGHGVGLAVHEEPRLAGSAHGPLPEGSIFSIEPGIYLPGWGGVRIEDLVLLTEKGAEVLSAAPKDPIVPLR